MNTSIIIYDANHKKSHLFRNAKALASSWASKIIYLEVDSMGKSKIEPDVVRISEDHAEAEIETLLISFVEEKNVLILPLVYVEVIQKFIKHFNNNSQVSNWQVITNNFERFLFLESRRALSSNIPNDTQKWILELIEKFGKEFILQTPEKLNKNVLLIGETIIDEYIYCEALGKVSKDPLIAFREQSKERHLGGILAATKHIRSLMPNSNVITEVNKVDSEYVKNNWDFLDTDCLIFEKDTSQVVKTRYVDHASNNRVFETYKMADVRTTAHQFKIHLKDCLAGKKIKDILVIDYGHGLIDDDIIKVLNQADISITVNAQTNAGNRGFNPISRYAQATRIFINGQELELEVRKKSRDRRELIAEIAPRIGCDELYVTQGSEGLLYWTEDSGVKTVPGFAPTIVDRVGAGDALLSVITALRINEVPIEISCFYGNIAGALIVGSMGNSLVISKSVLKENAQSILDTISN